MAGAELVAGPSTLGTIWPPRPVSVILIIGADGCGSEALTLALGRQLGVVLPKPPHSAASGARPILGTEFVSAEDRYTRGWAWYMAHYVLNASVRAIVDGSPGYLSAPYAAARLHSVLARPSSHRIVAVLRDPVEQAWVRWRALLAMPHERDDDEGAFLVPYLSPHNFTQKVAREASALRRCLSAVLSGRLVERHGERQGGSGGGGVGKSRSGARGGGVHSGRSSSSSSSSSDMSSGMSTTYISSETWQRCLAVACGWSGCVLGGAMYGPQLRTWRQAYGAGQVRVA